MSEVSFSDSLNRFKESFLWAAAQGGNTEDCESLLEIGAEVDWKNTDGDTALLAACRRGHADTVVLLLVYGASPNARGKDGLTPLHICARNADIKTLNVLLDAGADALLQTPDSHTALALAQQKGYENVVRRLTGDDSESMVPSVTIRETPSEQAVAPPGSARGRSHPASKGDTRLPVTAEPRSKPRLQKLPLSKSADVHPAASRDSKGVGHMDTAVKPRSSSSRSLPAGSYALIGADSENDFSKDEQYIALCKQLDMENRSKRALEVQVESLRTQLQELDISISRLHNEMAETDEKLTSQSVELNKLRGVGVDNYTLKECEDLERKLKCTLDSVLARKEKIKQEEMGQQKEQRMCVICQIEEKSVVLFPCRHMCLCETCANHEDLDACPLCRRVIVQRVSVFS